MKVLAGYDRGDAIAVMRARNTDKTTRGNPHSKSQQVQRTYLSGGRLKMKYWFLTVLFGPLVTPLMLQDVWFLKQKNIYLE